MEEIINQLLAVSEGLALLGTTWLIWFISGIANNLFNDKKWSWRRAGEDILKTILMVVATLGWVVVINLLEHYTGSLGIDISQFLDGASVVGLIGIIVGGAGVYAYKGYRNILKFFVKDHTILQQIEGTLVLPDKASVDYAKVADPAKQLLGALASSINAKQESDTAISGEVLTKAQAKKLAEMGASNYYALDVSTPQKAYQNLLGKGFNEGFGFQCVAGFKEFMFSLVGRYVAAGGAAALYASDPARSAVCKIGFTWHNGTAGLQDGDWGIWTNGLHGHVAMYYQGKWLGQNQGAEDGDKGNAFNLMALPMQGFAGHFRPNAYAKLQEDAGSTIAPIEKPASTSNSEISVGDKVTVLKYEDVNGVKLIPLQTTPYTVVQTRYSDHTAVLKSDDGDIYARMSFDNIRKEG